MTRLLPGLALLLAVLSAGPTHAQLVGQLSILDLTANSGINPATGNPWQAGDTYRFIFTTSGLTPATSTNISFYNQFVQNAADASPLNIGTSNDVTWTAIASTATMDARDNTATHVASNGTGEAIFLLDGRTIVATNYVALWTFDGHANGVRLTEHLTAPSNVFKHGDTWAGTHRSGYPDPAYGTADATGDGPLGNPAGKSMCGLWPHTSGTHWIWRWGRTNNIALPLYSLSKVLAIKGVSIAKYVSAATVNLDQGVTNLTYTIEVANAFTNSLEGLVVTDALPAEVSFIASFPPASRTNGNEFVFDLGTLGPETNTLITIDVLVTSTVPTVITNTASFAITNTNVTVTINLDTAETILFRPTDLAIEKSVAATTSNLTYTITVTNLSAIQANNVLVTDTLPPNTTYQTATPPPIGNSGSDYTFNLGSVLPNATTSITLSLLYTGPLPSAVTNLANVTTTTFEELLTNNTCSLVSLVGQGVDLTLVKTVNPTNLLSGATNLTYTLDINNIGTTSAVSVVVTDSLPAGVSFIMASPAPVQTNGNAYTFDLGTMASGGATSIVINAVYTAGLVGVTLTNWAIVSTPTQELSLINNRASATTVILDPLVDTDGDGMTDCAEIIAGTNPNDPTSYLWLGIRKTTDLFVRELAFPSVFTRTYHLQSSTNFNVGPWINVETNIPGIGAIIRTYQTNLLDKTYYRVGVRTP